ncbi:MAG: hypothetical protein Q9225_003124 [Loekoesia sp. 1 TL-2023]
MASDLVFINTSGPDDSKSVAKRKAVRSQAAKDHSQSPGNKPEGPASRRRHRKLLSVEIDLDIHELEAPRNGSPFTNANSSSLDQDVSPKHGKTDYRPPHNNLNPVAGDSTKSALTTVPGAGWTHPFVPYPDKKTAPAMLSHYLSEVAVDVPELDHPGAKGSLRSIWFPMTKCSPEVLYQLKEDSITSINRALKDPDLAISDQVIGAVAKMAAYEAGFAGDEEQYHIHMKGLTKMVELRGGLESLGLNGLLARMLLFIDLNAASLLKTKLYFPHPNAAPGNTVSKPNPVKALGKSPALKR